METLPTENQSNAPRQAEPIHIISLGAGVQSSTMAIMAAHGEITPMPKCAIFADTQDEPEEVYEHLMRLEKSLPFPIYRVTKGKLSNNLFTGYRGKTGRYVNIPSFGNRNGMSMRQCTVDFKISPVRAKIQELRGKSKCVLWMGISLDEVHRMKPAPVQYITNIWPLIDKRMSRHDCERWLNAHGWSNVPRSACEYCPFQSDSRWKDRKSDPKVWDRIKRIDAGLNKRGEYLHDSRVPIDQVDFSTDEDHGQQVMFGNECEGMCGV